MQYHIRHVVVWTSIFVQILAGVFLVLLMTQAPGSFMWHPTWSGAISTSFLAFSIAICGYGSYSVFKKQRLTWAACLTTLYAIAVAWYLWTTVHTGMHG